ncbi:hypothetical protein FH972_012931 [Carpinus fangiana]|uniref:Uncharacterized protein n=1 Tax=Carpinus fangiana TaxID=176857 RepID=A0A5N6R8L8_9ROSI|nr:hypothetical protein FH972_012931 [Carpinus fangiana]
MGPMLEHNDRLKRSGDTCESWPKTHGADIVKKAQCMGKAKSSMEMEGSTKELCRGLGGILQKLQGTPEQVCPIVVPRERDGSLRRWKWQARGEDIGGAMPAIEDHMGSKGNHKPGL